VQYLLGIYKDVIVDKEKRQRILENELAIRTDYVSGNHSPSTARNRNTIKNVTTPRIRNLEIWAERQSSLEEELMTGLGRPVEMEREYIELKSKYEKLLITSKAET
jgi:hypothetical protein